MTGTLSLNTIFLMGILILALPACVKGSETGFVDRTIETGSTVHHYKVYVPKDWTKDKEWPVILYLHGAGERGNDNVAQTRVGIGPAIGRQKGFSAITVFPQCLSNRWWSEPEMQEMAIKALDQSIKEFNGDTNRIYLTGLSMGGYGTWAIARDYPGRFAAYAPICGGVLPPRVVSGLPEDPRVKTADPYMDVAKKIGKTPVWVFHGETDPVVPVSESRKMVEALKSAGGTVRYSEYEGVGHNSWDRAYAEPEFFSWLLSQKLGPAIRTKKGSEQKQAVAIKSKAGKKRNANRAV